jgi:hypothetical protein
MSTIFISHSSQDNDIAREIERRLTSQGHHSVFLDIDPKKGIVGGQELGTHPLPETESLPGGDRAVYG